MLERIERHSGELLELPVTASGGREYTKLQNLIRPGYVARVDHPTVKAGNWPAEAVAITADDREALLGKKRRRVTALTARRVLVSLGRGTKKADLVAKIRRVVPA
jgi:hypothetical protein